jgi:AcrR family transcriptional regulator
MPARPTRKELTHERIVETAARALRRGGFAGVGVAEVMKEAGLTHGGFYAHFRSRDALLCEALEQASRDSATRLAASAAQAPSRRWTPLRALVEGYLSESHLRSPERGCPVAALAADMPRQSAAVRQVAARRVQGLIAAVRSALSPTLPAGSAAVIAGQLIGALQLARALGAGADAKALLAETRQDLLARYDADASR